MANIISKNIGIDLGTNSVLVCVPGKGIVINEPSVVAIDSFSKAVAFGNDAKNMLGRTPKNLTAVKPLRNGVISDCSVTELMLKHFIAKAKSRHIFKPSVVICIPCLASEVEKRAVTDAAANAGARRVKLIKEPIAAAIGAGIDINKPCGRMVVDIGGGSCDIAVISLGGIVTETTMYSAGYSFDDAIVRLVRRNFNVIIGERTAEDIKIKIGSVKKDCDESLKVSGLSVTSGLPTGFDISSEDIYDTLLVCAEKIVDSIKCVLERTPPELISDIGKNGILLTGGGSLLSGLAELIENSTGIRTYLAKDALSCVAKGTGIVAESL